MSLITRLGVQPPFTEGFELANVVTPVTLVDSDIVLAAQTTSPEFDTQFTQGELLSPADGTLLADTGALAAGTYETLVVIGGRAATDTSIGEVQRRDAANAVTVWRTPWIIQGPGFGIQTLNARFTLLASERIRAIARTGCSGNLTTNIWVRRVT